MTELTADIDFEDDIQPLALDGLDQSIITAMESINIVYHGLVTTPTKAYSQPAVQHALLQRIDEISTATNISNESIKLSLDEFKGSTYSTENAFIEAIRTIIAKILSWLTIAKDYVIKILKRVFNWKSANTASSKATEATFKKAETGYKKAEKTFPETVKVTVPGRFYILFHSSKHRPKPGFVYNHKGFETALENVTADISKLLDGLNQDIDNSLAAMELFIHQITSPALSPDDSGLRKLKSSKIMHGMYHNSFSVIGMGLISKPMVNQTAHIREKIGLTNLAETATWSGSDGFEVKLDTAKFKELNKEVYRNTNDLLSAIYINAQRLTDSAVLKKFEAIIKDQKILAKLSEEGTTTNAIHHAVLFKLQVVYEHVNQVIDNLNLLSSFYGRYVSLMNSLLNGIASELASSVE